MLSITATQVGPSSKGSADIEPPARIYRHVSLCPGSRAIALPSRRVSQNRY